MKKLLSITLAIIMVFATMSTAVFAEGEQKQFPNVYADVWTDNIDCIHSEDADVSLKITKGSMVPIVLDLQFDEDYGSYVFEGRTEGIDPIITEIAGNTVLMQEYADWIADLDAEGSFDILGKAGYTVEVIAEDNDADHELTVGEIDSSVLTKELIDDTTETVTYLLMSTIINASTDAEVKELAELFGGVDLLVKEDAVYIVYSDSTEKELVFTDLLELIKDEDLADEMELDEEDLADIKEYEDMIAAMEAGTYLGELIIDINLECECPVLSEYTLYHEYYDADDNYIDQTYIEKTVPELSVVKLEDIKLLEKYDGKEYKFVGLYIVEEDGECDWSKPVSEFTVPKADDEEYMEVVAKYVAEGETGSSGGTGEGTPSDLSGDSEIENIDGIDTGDDFNALPFAVVMLLAALGMGAAVVRRRA